MFPAGVYTLNYSVDSTRRVDNNYLVFTYFNFIYDEAKQATVTYNYTDSKGNETQKEVIVANDGTWSYQLEDYASLTSYHPLGYYFAGWTLNEGTSKVNYTNGKVVVIEGDLELYPVFTKRSPSHDVVWLSDKTFDSINDIQFTYTNMENSEITGVSYLNSSGNVIVDISKYVTIASGKFVTIKSSAFERIGYVSGGYDLTVSFNYVVNGKVESTYNRSLHIDYPVLTPAIPTANTYLSSFNSDEYVGMSNKDHFFTTETLINPLEENNYAIAWRAFNTKINHMESGGLTTDENDLALRIRYTKDEGYGYVISYNLFYNVKDISFSLSSNAYTKATVKVSLLDLEGNPIENKSHIIDDILKETDKFTPVSCSFNYEGVCFVKFEIIECITTDPENPVVIGEENEVRIDELTISFFNSEEVTPVYRTSYSTVFSTDEYQTVALANTATETTINGIYDSVMKWTVKHASIDSTGNNSAVSTDYGLRLHATTIDSTTGKYICGYAKTEEFITNINTFTFDMAINASPTISWVAVYAIDESNNKIPLGQYYNSKTGASAFETKIVDCSNIKSGNYKILFELHTNSTGTSTKVIVKIDNIKINAN